MPPIIDVHTHIFSALDIPLEGYLLSRTSEHRIGRLLDPWLSVFPMPQLYGYVAKRARERCIMRRIEDDPKRGWFYTFILWAYGKLALQRFLDWEDSLANCVETNADLLVKTWPEVDLFVPLMIDYEYWFANSIDNDLGEQIDTVAEKVVIPHKGRIHPFVPFDPARELAYIKGMVNPDGQLEKNRPMNLVRDAIENKGFIGVKLYNSLGYRPFNNGDPEVELKRRRIAIRNNKLSYLFDGEEYDEALCRLYDYCLENEVPITAHCVMNGIEAYPEASFHFGQARFWDEVLKQEKYRKLRLNLAHFGWNDAPGQGYAGDKSWVKDVCSLIVKYDNVFADVSHHRVLSDQGRARFIDGYKQMKRDHPGHIDKIKRRILYGSDWHVLRRLAGYKEFIQCYERVLREADFYLERELDDFRRSNAVEFLGLAPGNQNQKRIIRFFENQQMPPPGWAFLSGVGDRAGNEADRPITAGVNS